MSEIITMDELVQQLTDEELCQAVNECNAFDEDEGFDINGFLVTLCTKRYHSYYSRYLEITTNHIFKEAANRFVKQSEPKT